MKLIFLIVSLSAAAIAVEEHPQLRRAVADTFSVADTISLPMNLSEWAQGSYGGAVEEVDGALKMYGSPGSTRLGNRVFSRRWFDIRNSFVYIKWKASQENSASCNYCGYGTVIHQTGGCFTTHHSWGGCQEIACNVPYYTRFAVNADGSYTAYTATGNYDDSGGSLIREYTPTLTDLQKEAAKVSDIAFNMGDNYAGVTTVGFLHEVKITDPKPLTKPDPSTFDHELYTGESSIPSEFSADSCWSVTADPEDSTKHVLKGHFQYSNGVTCKLSTEVAGATALTFSVRTETANNYAGMRVSTAGVTRWATNAPDNEWKTFTYPIIGEGNQLLLWELTPQSYYRSNWETMWVKDVKISYEAIELQVPDLECGDGNVDTNAGETCDPASVNPPSGCRGAGTIGECTYCGDGSIDVDAGETCDPADPDAPSDCDETCTYCGDGIIDDGEECDGGDGCTPSCTLKTDSGDSGAGNNWCFSGLNFVEVQGKGPILMESLQIGDYVRVGKNKFSQVISFLHLDREAEAEFLQIQAQGLKTPLEVTSEHMVYVNEGATPVPASQVKVGDVLTTKNKVADIKLVKRKGVYTPLTESGTIAANGILASSYAAVHNHTPISQHTEAHAFFAVRRLMCAFNFDICKGETYTEDGFPTWLAPLIRFAVLNKNRPLIQASATFVGLPMITVAFLLEKMIYYYPFIVGLSAAFMLFAYNTKIKACKVKEQ